MQYRPDIVISDSSGSAIAIIEVKALNNADVQTATRYVRNLIAHGMAPHADYVMLVTPVTGYLWTTLKSVSNDSPPALTFPMHGITENYLPHDSDSTQIRGSVLESIVLQWLTDLANGIVVDTGVTESLRKPGFVDAVKHGHVYAHATA